MTFFFSMFCWFTFSFLCTAHPFNPAHSLGLVTPSTRHRSHPWLFLWITHVSAHPLSY
jgi:hypothetical protein